MGRSSTRHKREVQGMDAQGDTAPDYGEYNDFTEKLITPKESGGFLPHRTQPDADKDGNPDVIPLGGGGGNSGGSGGSGSGGSGGCD